jgi:hypothetical protein
LVFIFEYAKGMISGCHVEEPVILHCELKKKIAGTNRKEQGKKKNHRRNSAHGPKCRNQEESANAETNDRQEKANRSSQEPLKPDIAQFVGQQKAQGLGGIDQISERTFLVKRD